MGNKGEDKDKEDAPQTPTKVNPPSPREEGPSRGNRQIVNSWNCASCGHTNVNAKSRCAGIIGEGRCMAWRGGKRLPYFSKVRDVVERILEKKSVAEAKAADAYVNLVPDASDIFVDQQDKKGEFGTLPNRRKAQKDESLAKIPSIVT